MCEISPRLEEMPGEGGYPAYLAVCLSELYERAGHFTTANDEEGSVSVTGTVSPLGGNLPGPVTQDTLRIVKTFWAFDAGLVERRHFPTINQSESYLLYQEQLDPWFVENIEDDRVKEHQWVVDMLGEENELQEIVQPVGKDALPEDQQLTLGITRYLRKVHLQRNALHPTDTYYPPEKTYGIPAAIHALSDEAFEAFEAGVPVEGIQAIEAASRLNRIGVQEDREAHIEDLRVEITEWLRELY